MDQDKLEKEVDRMHAEQLALSILITNVFSKLAKNEAFLPAIKDGFDQSADVAEHVALTLGERSKPEHTVAALRIIEEIRAIVIGDVRPPKAWGR